MNRPSFLAGSMKPFGCGVVAGGVASAIVCVTLFFGAAAVMLHHRKAAVAPDPTFVETAGEGDAAILGLLAEARRGHGVPAMGAAIVTTEGIEAMGVTGVRKRGTQIPATLQDKWHLGSNTKAMTATLAAMLVEEGKLQWTSRLGDLFPEIDDMHPDLAGANLEQILAHRGGFPPNVDWHAHAVHGTPREQRAVLLGDLLRRSPAYKPGTRSEYSNVGYVVVGAIIEKVTDRSWEECMMSHIFEPLGMASAGFGGTGTPGQIDQPWPHVSRTEPAPTNGPDMDNPPVMGPAGTVHCSMADYCRFLQDHLRAGEGAGSLLKPDSYRKLHTPAFGDRNAAGWLALERSWGGGTVLNHAGSNTMNYVVVWMAPKKGKAVAVFLNVGDSTAFPAADGVASELIVSHFQ